MVTFRDEGSFAGATGCRRIQGTWTRDGNLVTVTGLPAAVVDCSRAGSQDDHVMSVLTAPFTIEISERALWVQQADGDLGLEFGADDPA